MVVGHASHCRHILEQETSQRDVALIQDSRIQHQRERACSMWCVCVCVSVLLGTPALIKSPCPFKYSTRLKLAGAHVINKPTCWGWKTQITGFHVNPFVHRSQFKVLLLGNLHCGSHLQAFELIYRCICQLHIHGLVCVCVCEHVRTYVMGHCVRNRPPVSEISEQYLTLGLFLLRPPLSFFLLWKAVRVHHWPFCVFTKNFRKCQLKNAHSQEKCENKSCKVTPFTQG